MPSIYNKAGEDVVAALTDEWQAIDSKRLLKEAVELGVRLGGLPGGSAQCRLAPW